MADNSALLLDIFQAVTRTLADNQQTLDKVDEYNHDHGTNMVQTFQTITRALQQKKDSPQSAALAFAAKELSSKAASGSGRLYAQGLAEAATQLKGRDVDAQSAMQLLQTLIGGGQSQQPAAQSTGGDALGALLGGLAGSKSPGVEQNEGLDMGDLLNASVAFLQSKQSGGSNTEALLQAVVAASGMGTTAHRAQSTQLVASSFLKAIEAFGRQS